MIGRRYSKNQKKWIEENKKKYSNEILELTRIVSHSNDEFTYSMLTAIITGRKITPKMETSIQNIIKRNSPEYRNKRLEWLNQTLPKINMVRDMVENTTWTASYKANTLYFIDSLITQAKKRLTLSEKQMKSLNKMYEKTKKRLENDKKLKKNEKKA